MFPQKTRKFTVVKESTFTIFTLGPVICALNERKDDQFLSGEFGLFRVQTSINDTITQTVIQNPLYIETHTIYRSKVNSL